jgi:hypothetical protein
MAKRRTQLEKAIDTLEQEIAVRQAAIAVLRAQQNSSAPPRTDATVFDARRGVDREAV